MITSLPRDVLHLSGAGRVLERVLESNTVSAWRSVAIGPNSPGLGEVYHSSGRSHDDGRITA